jgi:YesN/AraC family two-component response regulator
MNTAKALLRNTAMSINEVSYYLGFANAHYFSNFFSKREGVSPKEYRMSLVTSTKLE